MNERKQTQPNLRKEYPSSDIEVDYQGEYFSVLLEPLVKLGRGIAESTRGYWAPIRSAFRFIHNREDQGLGGLVP